MELKLRSFFVIILLPNGRYYEAQFCAKMLLPMESLFAKFSSIRF